MSGHIAAIDETSVHRVNSARGMNAWRVTAGRELLAPPPTYTKAGDETSLAVRRPVLGPAVIGSPVQRGGPDATVVCSFTDDRNGINYRLRRGNWRGSFAGFQLDPTAAISMTQLVLCSDFRDQVVIIGVGRRARCERWMMACYSPLEFNASFLNSTNINADFQFIAGTEQDPLETRVVICNGCAPRSHFFFDRGQFSRAAGTRGHQGMDRCVPPSAIGLYAYEPDVTPIHRSIGIGCDGYLTESDL
jgi:hypothetical protein